jgi:hypothetical protein
MLHVSVFVDRHQALKYVTENVRNYAQRLFEICEIWQIKKRKLLRNFLSIELYIFYITLIYFVFAAYFLCSFPKY